MKVVWMFEQGQWKFYPLRDANLSDAAKATVVVKDI